MLHSYFKPLFCHSGLDPESSHLDMLWIPAFVT
jgi:hypothetical protein